MARGEDHWDAKMLSTLCRFHVDSSGQTISPATGVVSYSRAKLGHHAHSGLQSFMFTMRSGSFEVFSLITKGKSLASSNLSEIEILVH